MGAFRRAAPRWLVATLRLSERYSGNPPSTSNENCGDEERFLCGAVEKPTDTDPHGRFATPRLTLNLRVIGSSLAPAHSATLLYFERSHGFGLGALDLRDRGYAIGSMRARCR